MPANVSIVDTNIIVRFLIRDNEKQYKQAVKWFQEATKGERVIIIKPAVIAEVVYVLESVYKQSKEQIASTLFPFVAIPVLQVEERNVLMRLWGEYVSGLHFVDAYLLTSAKQTKAELLTFDKQLLSRS